jgi:antitoxin component YwqK of YwqJK toxin-antitoxin module
MSDWRTCKECGREYDEDKSGATYNVRWEFCSAGCERKNKEAEKVKDAERAAESAEMWSAIGSLFSALLPLIGIGIGIYIVFSIVKGIIGSWDGWMAGVNNIITCSLGYNSVIMGVIGFLIVSGISVLALLIINKSLNKLLLYILGGILGVLIALIGGGYVYDGQWMQFLTLVVFLSVGYFFLSGIATDAEGSTLLEYLTAILGPVVIFFAVFSLSMIFEQKEFNETQNGVFKGHYSNKQLKEEGYYKDGERQGFWKFYHWNGNLQAKGKVKDGKSQGVWEFYHENGNLESKGKVKDGEIREGRWKFYYSNGKLEHTGNFKDGKQEGLWKFYNENGKLEQIGNCKDGKQEGLWKFYNENGKLKLTGNYKNGETDGKYKEYHENGKLKLTGNFKNGERDGKWTYYDENGKLKSEENYKAGDEIGLSDSGGKNSKSGENESSDGIVGVWLDDDGWGVEFTKDGKLFVIDKNGKRGIGCDYKLEGEKVILLNVKDGEFEISYVYKNGAVYVDECEGCYSYVKLVKKK